MTLTVCRPRNKLLEQLWALPVPEKLIPLFINNIRHKKPLPVYGKGENVRDWLYVEDHARAIDLIFHKGKTADTYNIGGFNEWKNIDIIKVVIKTVDRLLGRAEGEDMNLILMLPTARGTTCAMPLTHASCKESLAGNRACSLRKA